MVQGGRSGAVLIPGGRHSFHQRRHLQRPDRPTDVARRPGASSEVVGGDEPGRAATRGGPTLKVGIRHARRTRTFSYSVLCVSTGYVTHAVGGTNACLLVPSDNGLGLDPQFPGWLLGKGLREMRFPKSHTLLYSADGFDLVGKSTNNRGRRWRVMHVLPQKAACCAVRS